MSIFIFIFTSMISYFKYIAYSYSIKSMKKSTLVTIIKMGCKVVLYFLHAFLMKYYAPLILFYCIIYNHMHVCSSPFELSSAYTSPSLCLYLLLPLRTALSPTLKYCLDNLALLIRCGIWNLMKHRLLCYKFDLSCDKPHPSLTSVNFC